MIKEQELSKNLKNMIDNPVNDDILLEKLGNEELKTNDKTIKGSINEIINKDNDEKNKLIKLLESKNINIDKESNWDKIVLQIIDNII